MAGGRADLVVVAGLEGREAHLRPPFSTLSLQAGGCRRERGMARGAERVADGVGEAAAGGGWWRGEGSGSRELPEAAMFH